MRRAWIHLGVAVVLAFAAGGCGGGGGGDRLSKAEYQQEVKKVGDTLTSSVDGLTGAFSASPDSLDQVGTQIDELREAMNQAADDLDALEPLEDAQSAHDQLVEGIRGFADELGEVADAARDGDLAKLRGFSENFENSGSVKQIQAATEELQAKGYTLEE